MLGLIETGDRIKLSVRDKVIELLVPESEVQRRRSKWVSLNVPPDKRRGYDRLYAEQVLQADEGCDFSILKKLK